MVFEPGPSQSQEGRRKAEGKGRGVKSDTTWSMGDLVEKRENGHHVGMRRGVGRRTARCGVGCLVVGRLFYADAEHVPEEGGKCALLLAENLADKRLVVDVAVAVRRKPINTRKARIARQYLLSLSPSLHCCVPLALTDAPGRL